MEPDPPDAEELASCPFCEGHEDRTPPETFAVGPAGRKPNTLGWSVRVVPNLYPALERQEVVIHSPRHVTSFAELGPEEIAAVAEAWRARTETARAEGFPYVHASLNEGRAAGASLAHSHSQLAWLREPPPAVVEEAARLAPDGCALCELLDRERPDGLRLVTEEDGVSVLAAYAGRLPYELLIAGAHGDEASVPKALLLLAESIRRLRALEPEVPINAWLHTTGHPHVELLPRLTILASLELGTGIFINSLAPEEAAQRLRETQ